MLQTVADHIIHRLKMELMEDLGVLYGLGVHNPNEPDMEKARKLALQVSAPRDLYWLASRSGIGLHTESAMSADWDMAAAVVGAFYARVRVAAPQWVAHPEAAANAARAQESVEGRVLAVAAQTLAQTIIASGYAGAFDGSPKEVADSIRTFLKGRS